MAIYVIEPGPSTVHGHFSRDLSPVLTIQSGNTVQYRTFDAAWGVIEQPHPFDQSNKVSYRDRQRDNGHALCGPIAIQDAQPGMTLEVHLKIIRPGQWGWSTGAGFDSPWNRRLGVAEGPEQFVRWIVDAEAGHARNHLGHQIAIRPFMGILGMPPDEVGRHSTFPPRFCGGNIDCKELVAGSYLYLPIPVTGGLFSLGDGHAAQGDGEVAGPALECPMEQVEVEFHLHSDMHLRYPQAKTSVGWITFGFHEDLDEAVMIALDAMLDLMGEKYRIDRKMALGLASLVVDIKVTQIVNGVRGIHAVLPHNALMS
jgi:acetamidase/formamidase